MSAEGLNENGWMHIISVSAFACVWSFTVTLIEICISFVFRIFFFKENFVSAHFADVSFLSVLLLLF